MIYAGQEYGERGMDKEGFSGNDGRTTIFDYWSVDTLVRAAKRKLTAEEQALNAIYNKVLSIAVSEQAVIAGDSFDLMYANGHLQRQYAFLRKAGKEVLLVIANFADNTTMVSVNIPAHAFDYLNIKEKNAIAVNLMDASKLHITLKRDAAVSAEVPANGAVVLSFKA